MKLEIQIRSGSKTSDHQFELSVPASAAQSKKGGAPPAAKVEQSAARHSPKPGDGQLAAVKPLARMQDDTKRDAQPSAQAQGKASAHTAPERQLHFSSDGATLIADGEEISPGVYSILIDGRSYETHVSKRPGDGEGYLSPYVVTVGLRHYLVEIRDPRRWRRDAAGVQEKRPQQIVTPMPGKVVKVLVSENQEVIRDQGLLVIEAMKMQNEIRAPRAGRVERIYVKEETTVEAGYPLLRLV